MMPNSTTGSNLTSLGVKWTERASLLEPFTSLPARGLVTSSTALGLGGAGVMAGPHDRMATLGAYHHFVYHLYLFVKCGSNYPLGSLHIGNADFQAEGLA